MKGHAEKTWTSIYLACLKIGLCYCIPLIQEKSQSKISTKVTCYKCNSMYGDQFKYCIPCPSPNLDHFNLPLLKSTTASSAMTCPISLNLNTCMLCCSLRNYWLKIHQKSAMLSYYSWYILGNIFPQIMANFRELIASLIRLKSE